MTCPEKGPNSQCPIDVIAAIEAAACADEVESLTGPSGKMVRNMLQQQDARLTIRAATAEFFRSEGRRTLERLETEMAELQAQLLRLTQPKFDRARLRGACIDGSTVESIDTDGRCTRYRICGSLLLNEEQRAQEVVPHTEQEGDVVQ